MVWTETTLIGRPCKKVVDIDAFWIGRSYILLSTGMGVATLEVLYEVISWFCGLNISANLLRLRRHTMRLTGNADTILVTHPGLLDASYRQGRHHIYW